MAASTSSSYVSPTAATEAVRIAGMPPGGGHPGLTSGSGSPGESLGVSAAARGSVAVQPGGTGAASEETSPMTHPEALSLPAPLARMPVEMEVTVPVRCFRVHNLLAMTPGAIIETQWGHGDDLPLSSGDVQLAWSEFEVVDSRLAVRVTRLA